MTDNFSLDVPMNMGDGNGTLSRMTAISATESNALHQNNQKQILVEFPARSMLEGEPINNLCTGFNISNDVGILNSDASVPTNAPFERNTILVPSCPISNAQVPISAESLSALLAARSHHHDDLKELGTSVSNDYYDALNSASVTSLNCGYDGIIGTMNNKWDSDNFPSFQLVGNINPGLWVSSENSNVNLDKPSGSSKFRNKLSLSHASCQPSFIHGTRVHCSGLSCSGVTCLALNEKQLGPETYSNSSDDFPNGDARFEAQMDVVIQKQEVEAKKKKLLGLLQLVDDQYNQCPDEIHTVISPFHAATKLDSHIHARFVLQTISSLYKNLRERISAQVLRIGEYSNRGDTTREEDKSFETSFIQKQWALQQLQRKDHQVWRPPREACQKDLSRFYERGCFRIFFTWILKMQKQLLAVRSGLIRVRIDHEKR